MSRTERPTGHYGKPAVGDPIWIGRGMVATVTDVTDTVICFIFEASATCLHRITGEYPISAVTYRYIDVKTSQLHPWAPYYRSAIDGR